MQWRECAKTKHISFIALTIPSNIVFSSMNFQLYVLLENSPKKARALIG